MFLRSLILLIHVLFVFAVSLRLHSTFVLPIVLLGPSYEAMSFLKSFIPLHFLVYHGHLFLLYKKMNNLVTVYTLLNCSSNDYFINNFLSTFRSEEHTSELQS